MKKPISSKQNLYNNGTALDANDLSRDQEYNNQIQTGIIANHFGSGVLADTLNQPVLFDSSLLTGLLDGKAIDIQTQPSDANYGNQLELSLTDSTVASKRSVKVFIVGLDFQNNLQYETFSFHKNEKQISEKHYIQIIKIYFNDLIGDPNQSLNLGGTFLIKEAKPLFLSRSCKMVAQDIQPNIILRDFFVSGAGSLSNLLTSSLPNYNIDNLGINIGYNSLRALAANDVSTQIGQKFQASTNNIQKITLLLSVSNSVTPSNLVWTGNLIFNLYQLQSSIDCPLDIAPNTAIDFDPSNIPLVQISLSYNDLLNQGVSLNETPQPVDFVLSNTAVGSGSIIAPGSYYVVALKRGGAADTCSIQVATGADVLTNSLATVFNGSIWVNLENEDLWFQVWTDAAKVSDGQAYDEGQGVIVSKTIINSLGATEDHLLNNIPFIRNDVYYGLLEATTEQSALVQDQRTGESVFSEKQLVPNISLITGNDLINREKAADPLLIGTISDKNSKIFSANSINLSGKFHAFGMVKNQCVIKLIDDPSDGYRYDTDILNLANEISGSGGISDINGLIGGKFIPDTANPNTYYRIADTEYISMLYGDLDGNGVVDDNDLILLNSFLGTDINSIPNYSNYGSLTSPFVSQTNLAWQALGSNGTTVLASGTGAYIAQLDPNPSIARLNAPLSALLAVSFFRISGDTTNPGNNGTFRVIASFDQQTFDVQKNFYSSDGILRLMQADINGDMIIDSNDVSLMSNYINKVAPFPNTTSPANRIGTVFNAIRLTLQPYIDRADDYTASSSRGTSLHATSDLLLDGYQAGFSRFGQNLKTSPLSFSITKQLNWFDYFVVSNSNPKLVSAVYSSTTSTGFSCDSLSTLDQRYPIDPIFDPGKNDQFIPSNLIINNGGQLVQPDGNYYPVDLEIETILFEIPAVSFTEEKNINLFTDFVADFNGNGTTRLGYPALRYADCSTVSLADFNNQKVRFSVSLNSFSPEINGVDVSDSTISGVIVDGGIGVYFNASNAILTLNFSNLYEDSVLLTQKTRILITVFLKKAGFKNAPLTISSSKLKNLLGL